MSPRTMLLVLAMLVLPVAAQAAECSIAPGSDACQECLERFPGDGVQARTMREIACYDRSLETPPQGRLAHCSFSECPADVEAYEECIGRAVEMSGSGEVDGLSRRLRRLLRQPLQEICSADGIGALQTRLSDIQSRYAAVLELTDERFNACLDHEIARYDRIIRDAEEGFGNPAEDTGRQRSHVALVDAYDQTRKLFRLRGDAIHADVFGTIDELRDIEERLAVERQSCESLQ